ncbi:MAG: hypothetical protein R6W99_07470 [Clostridia bacterium]
MNGWVIGGILCMLYAGIVSFLAYKKSPGLIKVVKMKMGKKMTEKGAITTCYVMSGIVFIAGIIFFIIS